MKNFERNTLTKDVDRRKTKVKNKRKRQGNLILNIFFENNNR